MNLAGLDLNLLVVLHALLDTQSVGRAAARVGLSQPAASHALARLRRMFGDPLLVRTGAGMALTPRAESLKAPLAEALAQVKGLFGEEGFEPATSRRRFVLMMPDLVVSIVMPLLLPRLEAAAPGVRLSIAPWRGPAMMTPEFARTVDLVASFAADAFPGFQRLDFYRDRDVLAVRRGHPVGAGLAEMDAFKAARHVAVVGRGERGDPVDAWLAEVGVRREVVFAAPSYLQALQVAAASDLVAFVPHRLARGVGPGLGLEVVEPPVDPGFDQQYLYYPARLAVDPASIWLRQQVLATAADLPG
jgi:DNA-binding transcriptional LysR family regulator